MNYTGKFLSLCLYAWLLHQFTAPKLKDPLNLPYSDHFITTTLARFSLIFDLKTQDCNSSDVEASRLHWSLTQSPTWEIFRWNRSIIIIPLSSIIQFSTVPLTLIIHAYSRWLLLMLHQRLMFVRSLSKLEIDPASNTWDVTLPRQMRQMVRHMLGLI